MTHLVKALGKLDKEFGEASFREKDYPSALFHGLHAVTKLKKFTMGGMQQFNYEGFISTTADESVALSFAGGISTLPSSGSEQRGNCIIKLTLNDSYLEMSSKYSKSDSFKKHKAHKFAGFVGDVSWLSRFRHEREYLIFPLETLPVIGVTEDFEGTSQKRYHVVTGGTQGQLSTPLEHLYASLRTKKKPVAAVAPMVSVPLVKAPVALNTLQNIALKPVPKKEAKNIPEKNPPAAFQIALKPSGNKSDSHIAAQNLTTPAQPVAEAPPKAQPQLASPTKPKPGPPVAAKKLSKAAAGAVAPKSTEATPINLLGSQTNLHRCLGEGRR